MSKSASNKLLFNEIRNIVEQSKNQVSVTVNTLMTQMYWNIGKRINQDVLQEKRAE